MKVNVFEGNVRGVLDEAKTSCSSHDGFIIIISPSKIMIDCKIM
jgi:hypothetical protein